MQEQTQRVQEQTQQALRSMENIPVQAYLYGALGSILLSAALYFSGRRHLGLFVGQWPTAFLGMALVYRLLRPSRERPGEAVRETFEQARGTVQRQQPAA